MHSTAGSQSVKAKKEHKPYVAPTYKRLTPEEAKDLLLRRADIDDPEVKPMLGCTEHLQKHGPFVNYGCSVHTRMGSSPDVVRNHNQNPRSMLSSLKKTRGWG